MAYKIIWSRKTVNHFVLYDYFVKLIWIVIDCRVLEGQQQYIDIFGYKKFKLRSALFLDPDKDKIPLGLISVRQSDFKYLLETLNERSKRLFVGLLFKGLQRGMMSTLSKLSGLNPKTISKGKKEIEEGIHLPKSRSRKAGGGRSPITRVYKNFNQVLEKLLGKTKGGDPMNSRLFVRKDLRWFKKQFVAEKITVSITTIRSIFRKRKITLKGNSKSRVTKNHPQRDRQFKKKNQIFSRYERSGQPMISIDGKKKEQIGLFKNPGRNWSEEPTEVLDHDFPSLGTGKLVPFGIYDINENKGYVYCGTSKETAEFAVDSLVLWWQTKGQFIYPNARSLLIFCDAGKPNDYRWRSWKWELQTRMADQFGLNISVCHYPSGCSKYNPIEHRLFSEISKNWQGEPLDSYPKALGFINSTETKTGLEVTSVLIDKIYETGRTVSDEQMASLNIHPHKILPQWNYTIKPRTQSTLNVI